MTTHAIDRRTIGDQQLLIIKIFCRHGAAGTGAIIRIADHHLTAEGFPTVVGKTGKHRALFFAAQITRTPDYGYLVTERGDIAPCIVSLDKIIHHGTLLLKCGSVAIGTRIEIMIRARLIPHHMHSALTINRQCGSRDSIALQVKGLRRHLNGLGKMPLIFEVLTVVEIALARRRRTQAFLEVKQMHLAFRVSDQPRLHAAIWSRGDLHLWHCSANIRQGNKPQAGQVKHGTGWFRHTDSQILSAFRAHTIMHVFVIYCSCRRVTDDHRPALE